MRARPIGGAVALVLVAVVVVAPFATATLAPHDASSDAPRDSGTVAVAPQTTTASATTRGEPPESARIVARYPAENGSMVERTVLTSKGVARVEPPVNASRGPGWRVGMTLTDAGAERFVSTLVDTGFTAQPGDCRATDARNDEGHCLLVVVDGDVTAAFGLSPGLARSIESGSFQESQQLVLAAENESEAVAVWRGFLDDGPTDATATTVRTTTSGTDTVGASTAGTTTGAAEADSIESESTTASASGTASDSTAGFGVLAALVASVVLALALGRARGR